MSDQRVEPPGNGGEGCGEPAGATEFVDIHCHCLPGLDDGPSSLAEALRLCRALVEDGITRVIATPHQLGGYEGRNDGPQVRSAVGRLNESLRDEGVVLEVLAGGDVRIDERIPRLIDEKSVLTLADGGRYLLLELPHEAYIEPMALISSLVPSGVCTIVSHPERHRFVQRHPRVVVPWLEAGSHLQITAGSLLGDFGRDARAASWHFLESGQAGLVATDAHHADRRPPR
ncbi:MAG: hypothetical protein CME06_02435, partial [Gemmatimonadetes bacterium]|nr:hypothetical protein [Gemmatimonadota bacterium]